MIRILKEANLSRVIGLRVIISSKLFSYMLYKNYIYETPGGTLYMFGIRITRRYWYFTDDGPCGLGFYVGCHFKNYNKTTDIIKYLETLATYL